MHVTITNLTEHGVTGQEFSPYISTQGRFTWLLEYNPYLTIASESRLFGLEVKYWSCTGAAGD